MFTKLIVRKKGEPSFLGKTIVKERESVYVCMWVLVCRYIHIHNIDTHTYT